MPNAATIAAYLAFAEELYSAVTALLTKHASATTDPDVKSATVAQMAALTEKHEALKATANK